jgi:RNA polymerase sigma factor (TIGR02999 family)
MLCSLSVNNVTHILEAVNAGDPGAADRLLPLVYDELRRLAAAQMARENPAHTLEATALVHEAYLRLLANPARPSGEAPDEISFKNRRHFFAAAAQAMRRILVETARRKSRLKRGGGQEREHVELDALAAELPDEELLHLHDALERLAINDPAKSKLVELRFFGGMSMPEIAAYLEISLSTAERNWRYARAWLYRSMTGEENPAAG